LPREQAGPFRSSVVDLDCARTMSSDFGWKHGVPPKAEIAAAPHGGYTLFVGVAKHPVPWLKSLVRRPYNPVEKAPKNFSEFIRHDWHLTPRDNIPGRDRVGAVELWNLKNAAFRDLADCSSKNIVLAYEQILMRPRWFLKQVGAHLIPVRKKFVWSLSSTKGDDMTFEEYQKKYLTQDIAEGILPDDMAFIRDRIDQELMKFFGYEWSGTGMRTAD
ncbi:MAG TPA: hypothetical protein VHY79_18935, partial [Rhizomicrobium sp.]|nr:hypothetical protein [Rhizomicrobium sp.]